MQTLRTLLIAGMLGIATAAGAQKSYHIPEDYKLEAKEDFMTYKKDVLEAVEYLKQLPAGQEVENRKAVSSFLMQWAIGSPDVSIVITENVTGALADNGDLLILYTGGWTSYVLRTGDTVAAKGNIAGVRTVLDYYKNPANKVKRNKKLEQWLRKDEAGTLDAYLTEQLSATGKQ